MKIELQLNDEAIEEIVRREMDEILKLGETFGINKKTLKAARRIRDLYKNPREEYAC